MAESGKLFHESWYRIADQRISLRPRVTVQRQVYRGSTWYVVRDPFSNQFYRLNPGTYGFVSRLRPGRTVEEVWKETVERDPAGAPGQGDVVELLAQLYHANLLHYTLPPDSAKLFERYKKKKQRILKATLKNIMFFRIPLFDPTELLGRVVPLIRVLIGPVGALAWLFVVGLGVKEAVESFGALRVQSEGILAPSNLLLLYVGMVIVKTLHEFGHAFAVRRFGGEVHTMGVMFLIFSPLPYMDASASWAFRRKWERVFVGAAGMIFEVFVASCAMLVWANTGPGTVHALAYNMVFVASVSTVLFNINPLLRFDGYYILSDLLDMPNLHQQASKHLKYLVEQYAFGCRDCETSATTPREAALLTTFGILSGIYRVFVFSTILLFVADEFLLAGIIMVGVCVFTWGVLPLIGVLKYLGSSPRLHRRRPRAIAVTSGAFVLVLGILFGIPFPFSVRATGIVKASEYVVASTAVPGRLVEVVAESGSRVGVGDPLLRLENPELELALRETRAGLVETESRHRRAMQDQQADLAPIASRLAYYRRRLDRLERDREALVVRSEVDGIWVAPRVEERAGMWLPRGSAIGELIGKGGFTFVSVVSQSDISELFDFGVRQAEVKVVGRGGQRIPVQGYETIPMEQTQLPSAALGWTGGGDIAVDVRDTEGTQTAEPYYQVRAEVGSPVGISLLHGQSGMIRFALEPKPLAWQGWRQLMQLIQDRYQV